jgi:N-acyl-D-amino-acid deacylase
MGREAVERHATTTEVDAMRGIVEEALAAGAIGFSTSHSPTHTGAPFYHGHYER